MPLRIVVDENVPLAREAFAPFGEVVLRPGRTLDAASIADADALVVRSVTRVDARLLADSRVRFVGTATIGTDHVDLAELERRGIAFAYAPGCNARSVAEYVVAALLELEVELGRTWAGATVGVVGVGNVGTQVVEVAQALGARVVCSDPPRAAAEPGFASLPLAELLAQSDVVTCHVPLLREGSHPTHRLLDADALARLRDGAVVINTSRGGVVDEEPLRRACESGRLHAVLDVWRGEPEPDPAMIAVARLATPHIAGYSLDGKLAGTRMIADALQRHLGVAHGADRALFSPPVASAAIDLGDATGRDALRVAVRRVYAIRDDDARFRAALDVAPERRGPAFDRLRRDYPVRREFAGHRVSGRALGEGEKAALEALGFAVVG